MDANLPVTPHADTFQSPSRFEINPIKRSALRIPCIDFIVGVLIILTTVAITACLYKQLSFTITYLDVWFDSDSNFVFDQITNRGSRHNDTNSRHPIFVLLTLPFVFLQTRLFGIESVDAALVLLLFSSSFCVLAMYAALRLGNRSVIDSLAFTAIFVVSSAGLLFLGIHERLILGCASILVCIIVYQLCERGSLPTWALVAAAAGTLGITITNFVVGLVALALGTRPKAALQGSINAFVIIVILSAGSLFFFRQSTFFIDVRSWPFQLTSFSKKEPKRIEQGGTMLHKASVFWLHSVVLPEPSIVRKSLPSDTRYLSVQKGGLGNHRPVGYLALTVWLILLGMGLGRLLVCKWDKVDVLVGVCVFAQCMLFLVFGTETILYAPYYVPLLILLVSRPLPGSAGRLVFSIITALFLIVQAINNVQIYNASVGSALEIISEQQITASGGAKISP